MTTTIDLRFCSKGVREIARDTVQRNAGFVCGGWIYEDPNEGLKRVYVGLV